jgi:hypothetical protein
MDIVGAPLSTRRPPAADVEANPDDELINGRRYGGRCTFSIAAEQFLTPRICARSS